MATMNNAEILKTLPKPKNGKVDVSDLITDPKIQIRFQAGESTFGFQTNFDDTSVNDLKVSIAEVGRIIVPLTIWKRPGKTEGTHELVILQGNRRSKAGRELKADPNIQKLVHDALSKTDALIYEGLTEQQALALVDDQSSVNRYKRVDVVNVVWKMMYHQTDYKEIGLAHARLIGEVYLDNNTQAKANLVKLNEAKTRTEQLQIVGTWLRGSLDQGIMDANYLGDRVRKAFLLSVAYEDGLVKEDMEKPEFNPKARQMNGDVKTKQTRIAILKKIKKDMEDARKIKQEKKEEIVASDNWDDRSSQFHQKIEEFIAEDKGEKAKTESNRPTALQLTKLRDAAKSTAVKAGYDVGAGNKLDAMEMIDSEAYRCEKIMESIAKILPAINNPDVATVLAFVLKSGNDAEFVLQMKQYIS